MEGRGVFCKGTQTNKRNAMPPVPEHDPDYEIAWKDVGEHVLGVLQFTAMMLAAGLWMFGLL